ncbi:hypothetical protein SRABI66_04307 [Stenotrophomonas lactitubi]|nr:hypothetical protein SRABI66_04307 [Stenotrophomonas lactitubi]
MAAVLSAISARPIFGIWPSLPIRPARLATPIRVPELSNRSTNRKAKITLTRPMSSAPLISSCRKVGARDGGTEVTPMNGVKPRTMEATVTARMPISTAPRTARASSATISTKPRVARIGAGCFRSPRPTMVAGLLTTIPALCRAISARNRPMPAAIAERRGRGMALMIHSRMRKIDSRKNSTAEMNTAPSATCQVWPMCRTTV